jgi:carbonic anhydrase/acetyltransferase-like protein (isoleucine patch superfamily)
VVVYSHRCKGVAARQTFLGPNVVVGFGSVLHGVSLGQR